MSSNCSRSRAGLNCTNNVTAQEESTVGHPLDDRPSATALLFFPLIMLSISIASKSDASWLLLSIILSLKLYFPRGWCSKSKGKEMRKHVGDGTVLSEKEEGKLPFLVLCSSKS